MSSRACQLSGHDLGTSSTFGPDREPSSERRQSGTRLRAFSPIRPETHLYESPYGTIDMDARHSVVRFVRSDRPYATIADIYSEGIQTQRVLDGLGKLPLLGDLRAAAPRYDQGFEVAIADFRRRVFGQRHRTALVVRTAIGALQVKRHMREDGLSVEVFGSEEEALSYLGLRSWERTSHPRHDSWMPRPR